MRVTIRADRPGDSRAVRAVLTAAFGGPVEAELVDALRRDPQAWLDWGSVVADGDGQVVGHALLSRARVGGRPALALAPVGVLPGRQGRGIGSALVLALIDAARARDEQLVVVLGDPAYYARFGFRPAAGQDITGPYGSGPEFQALAVGSHPPGGRIRYPRAFQELG